MIDQQRYKINSASCKIRLYITYYFSEYDHIRQSELILKHYIFYLIYVIWYNHPYDVPRTLLDDRVVEVG